MLLKIFHSYIWRSHHYRWMAANFYLNKAHMAIEQWQFFSVPRLMLHGSSVYNGHLWDPWHSHQIPSFRHLELSLSVLPVFTTYICSSWDSNSQPSACEANALLPPRSTINKSRACVHYCYCFPFPIFRLNLNQPKNIRFISLHFSFLAYQERIFIVFLVVIQMLSK